MPPHARIYIFLTLLVVLVTSWARMPAEAAAHSAVIIDATTRRVLYERNANEPMYPASTTKVITSLVVIENARPDERVRITPPSVGVEGSSIWLENGEVLTVEDLLYGILLESGNDAAHALATYVAGDVQLFARLMTDRSRQAGATHTLLQNPHGLPDDEHVISALDMALVTADFLEYDLLKRIAATETHSIPWADNDWNRRLYNHNRALGIDGIDGVKTGYTRAAQHTFVGSATRDGHQLIGVVMHTTRNGKFDETRALFNEAFDTFEWKQPQWTGPSSVSVKRGLQDQVAVDVSFDLVPISRDGTEVLTVEPQTINSIEAPVEVGQQLGEALVRVNGEVVYRVPVVARNAVARRYTLWERLIRGARGITGR